MKSKFLLVINSPVLLLNPALWLVNSPFFAFFFHILDGKVTIFAGELTLFGG